MTGEILIGQLCLMQLKVEHGMERMGQLVQAAKLLEQFEADLPAPVHLQTLLVIYDRAVPRLWDAETDARNRQFVQDAHAKHRALSTPAKEEHDG